MRLRYSLTGLLMMLSPSALAGTPPACGALDSATCLSRAERLAESDQLAEARRLADETCAKDGTGCVLAATLATKLGLHDDARKRVAPGCEKGVGLACLAFGINEVAARNFTGALSPLEKACAAKEARGCALLRTVKEFITATEKARSSCSAGDAESCRKLEALGKNGNRAPARSLSLTNDPSVPKSQLAEISDLLREHDGRPNVASFELALRCRKGLGSACAILGEKAFADDDLASARQWTQSGCDRKVATSCLLRSLVAKSEGDAKSVRRFLDRACELTNQAYCADARRMLEHAEVKPKS